MFLKITIGLSLALSSMSALAQTDGKADPRVVATAELEQALTEADKLNDKLAAVSTKARAAALLSYDDATRSEAVFLQLWKTATDPTDREMDQAQAKLQILKYLFPRNPKLARRLLASQTKAEVSAAQPRTITLDSNPELPAKLAFQLLDSDPSAAASLLEESLARGPSPASMGALSRLREKDSILSDYVASKTLDGLATQPTLMSLSSLELITGYVFPGSESASFSPEAETSLQGLQYKYFVAAYDTLRASLNETNETLLKGQHLTQRDLQFRAANQAEVAAILAALAPRFQPSLAVELTGVANRTAGQIPPNLSSVMQYPLARLSGKPLSSSDPEQIFFFALSKGDFEEARRQLDSLGDDAKKQLYMQLTIKSHARALLTKGEVMPGVMLIRKLDDQTTRLVMYLDALKAARKKRDADLTKIIIDEARLLIPQVDRNGLHARALLSFATQLSGATANDDAVEFLSSAVTTIDALAMRPSEPAEPKSMAEAAMAELNNPNSLLDAPEMEQAFSTIGQIDLERALEQAKRIEPRAVQLTARLEAIQSVIKLPRSKPKSVTPPKPAAKSVNQTIPRL
jgi:hypothetical protein